VDCFGFHGATLDARQHSARHRAAVAEIFAAYNIFADYQALAEADIVCTATTSAEPVFADHELREGVHINGVGSYTPEMAEIPAETVQRARVVIDHRQAALQEAGDLIQPLRRGLITPEHCQTELGDIIVGRQAGRENPRQITFFKSVGVAVQDAAAAQLALANARAWNLGTVVPF
jgi:ornithine cyclodeaminase